ncbi:hypothetical protein T01_2658 [Trichinella spiralis]|uniref:Uncharacterized protein n=1 Tax=Trichinella spiralis TaxID=6334 RepID=A0A0V1BMQ3_TRISP|nr:hypothetical protein T01_2658 [Trichinella spiralis]
MQMAPQTQYEPFAAFYCLCAQLQGRIHRDQLHPSRFSLINPYTLHPAAFLIIYQNELIPLVFSLSSHIGMTGFLEKNTATVSSAPPTERLYSRSLSSSGSQPGGHAPLWGRRQVPGGASYIGSIHSNVPLCNGILRTYGISYAASQQRIQMLLDSPPTQQDSEYPHSETTASSLVLITASIESDIQASKKQFI